MIEENLRKLAESPTSLTPLFNAVTLFPCGHNLNEETIQSLHKKRCPECQTEIQTYKPDPRIRGIAYALTGNRDFGLIPRISKAIQRELGPDLALIPFPGKSAHFTKIEDWHDCEEPPRFDLLDFSRVPSPLIRSMTFQSTTLDSFLSELKILGYRDGSLIISISPNHNLRPQIPEWKRLKGLLTSIGILQSDHERYRLELEKFGNYLRNIGLTTTESAPYYYHSKDNEDAKRLFAAVALHNEIPQKDLDFISAIIKSGDWRIAEKRK